MQVMQAMDDVGEVLAAVGRAVDQHHSWPGRADGVIDDMKARGTHETRRYSASRSIPQFT